jgi:hypothetical protein
VKAWSDIARNSRVVLLRAGRDGRAFTVRPPNARGLLCCVASWGDNWDHVSVHVEEIGLSRTPTWDEMDFIHSLVARKGETWMQLHVPKSDHVNLHPNVLHLWRPHDQDVPRPPDWMV